MTTKSIIKEYVAKISKVHPARNGTKKPNTPHPVNTKPKILIPREIPYILFIIDGNIEIIPP